MGEERIVISAKISKDAAEGWRNFCDGNGISLTAMLEVAGLDLLKETVPPRIKERLRMVDDAREVDRLRRMRQRN
ncbi:MAG: hypothetical protein KZQ90_20640 [Candidatus Thiodiazotropha sp. (ex Codakia rugifera)]|nr:hypothetical protein [Candidatus Thiodiazotropha sp. (ex Codakia rugifera)]